MKLLIGGSPCTYWSVAQKKDRETEASGQGWELFKNYLIALEKYKPDFFLYENNKSMSPAIREQITREFGLEPVFINSALVSAQNRERLYWVGRRNADGSYSKVDVPLPEDRGIFLRDILESGMPWREKAYALLATAHGATAEDMIARRQRNGVAEPVGVGFRNRRESDGKLYRRFETHGEPKSNALTTVQTDSMVAVPIRIGTIENDAKNAEHDSQQYRVYSPEGKSVTLCGNGGGVGAKTGLYAVPVEKEYKTPPVYEVSGGMVEIKGRSYPIKLPDGTYIIRKLTVTESKRCQTVPDSFAFTVSDSQAYKMLGNGWTVDVIAHIMSQFDGITTEPLDVFSMYDGMACGHIALDKLGGGTSATIGQRKSTSTRCRRQHTISRTSWNWATLSKSGQMNGCRLFKIRSRRRSLRKNRRSTLGLSAGATAILRRR